MPGSNGDLKLTVDDITRNQVMASLGQKDGSVVLSTVSLQPGTRRTFYYANSPYELSLTKIDNALIGEDYATFTVSEPPGGPTESAKIEKLIETIASLKDATFVRNGQEHTTDEAAAHLRRKWRASEEQVTTAREFIDALASRSSVSGRPYQIRLPDGRTVNAGEFLHEQLKTMR